MKKKLIRKTITQIQSMKHFRKDKKYIVEDEEQITSLNEFRNFQRFLEKMVILSRHTGIKIRGAITLEREKNQ